MSWKFAVHSIAWKRRPLDEILREIKSAGYSGVELFQHPKELGGARAIVEAFAKSGLHLVGIATGSFGERCNLVREIASIRAVPVDDPTLPYIYVDEWRDDDHRFTDALDEGLRLGLHPHMYKPVQTMHEAERILNANPRLGFLPDTAHLQIAGDDPADAIRKYASRLVAVHLKAWREDVGRSYHFYARGFCELGEGNVDLVERTLDALLKVRFAGWLVVEQDLTTHPAASAVRSLEWLTRRLFATSQGIVP